MATLRTQNLTKSYSGRTVVKGVSLDVASSEIVGLLGPNGAGKTTTFYMTVGLTQPDSGRVELDGRDVTDDPMYIRARKGIGYLPQEPSIFRGLTVEQNLMAILETTDLDGTGRRARLRELLAELNLTPLAQAPAHTLSGGERRRAEITRALVISPKFKGNTVFGKSDPEQLLPMDAGTFADGTRPVAPPDILATLLSAFGIDPRKHLRDGDVVKSVLL